MKEEDEERIQCSSRSVGVLVVRHVVDEEVNDVGEEVVVGEVLDASNHASALPKNLIAPLPYRITRDGVPEAYYPLNRCTPEDGTEKTWKTAEQGFGTRTVRDHVFRTNG